LADKKVGYDSSCDHIQEEDIQHHGQHAEEKENNSCLIQKLHRPPPPLTEEEIDLLLNSHVATPAYIDLQHSHSPEHVSETSSITENENLSLNHDSHGTLEEVSKPIYDDDFRPEDHLVDIVLFHEEDRVVMFNNLEECLLFEDALDYDLEECGSEIDSFTVDIPSICLTDDTPELSDEPVYDEYPEEQEEQIYFSSHMKIYNSPPLFDECDESVSEDDEQQETLVQQESNQQHHERDQPMYDSYQEDLWTTGEGHKEGLLKQLISPPCLATIEQQTSKFQCDIFAPVEEKISSGQSAQKHFRQLAQQEEVWINCESGISLPFYDPIAVYMESKWGTEFFISNFLKSEFQNYKYLLPGHVLKFAAAPVILLLKDGSIIKFVSRILAWLIWKFSYT
jgi:hypothetical protein